MSTRQQKVLAKVLLLEKQYLRPVLPMKLSEPILSMAVRKDNTILFESNQYSVPLETYRQGLTVNMQAENDCLLVKTKRPVASLQSHISLGKG